MISDEEKSAYRLSRGNVEQTALKQLEAIRSAPLAVGFIANLHRSVDKAVQETSSRGPTVACSAGCAYCCSVRVEATDPEIFLIARALKARAFAEIAALKVRLEARASAAENPDPNGARINCGFLENNLCSIYTVRPAACRKAHSLSVERCKGYAPEIPQNLETLLAAEALMQGTSGAYRRATLGAAANELNRAVLMAMSDDTLEEKWYGGASVFAKVGART